MPRSAVKCDFYQIYTNVATLVIPQQNIPGILYPLNCVVLESIFFSDFLFSIYLLIVRIQTGKLSEFLITSCCTHLSFMDPGPESKLYSEDYDDNYTELESYDWTNGCDSTSNGKVASERHWLCWTRIQSIVEYP